MCVTRGGYDGRTPLKEKTGEEGGAGQNSHFPELIRLEVQWKP